MHARIYGIVARIHEGAPAEEVGAFLYEKTRAWADGSLTEDDVKDVLAAFAEALRIEHEKGE